MAEQRKDKIVVQRIEEKEWNGRQFWNISGEYANQDMAFTASCWSTTLKDKLVVDEANWLEWTETVKGQYTNRKIVNVGDSDGTFPERKQPSGGGFSKQVKADPAKTESIERQSAIKTAMNGVVGGAYQPEQLEGLAESILNFIQGGKNES